MHIVDIDDTRTALTKLFGSKGFKVGAEIGVDRGLFSKEICEGNPGVKLYCIDPWKTYNQYADMKDQHFLNINFRNTTKRLEPYNCEIMKMSSMAAIKQFRPNQLDFVYIDGNHAYDYVLEDCNKWSKIVRPGGIVAGHDYTTKRHKFVGLDVKRAVDQHILENNIETLYVYRKQGSSTWYYLKK